MMNEELSKEIERAIKGDVKAFESVMAQKAQYMYYIALKLMGNGHDAEDAVQEAMLRMYHHIGELKQPAAFHSWMYQIVSRTCLNLKKKLARDEHDELLPKDELNEMRREFLPQEYVEDLDKRKFLLEVIDRLPERYKLSLLLFYFEDMTYQEIAGAMDVTEKTVENILRRAKRKIKQDLDDRFPRSVILEAFQGMAAIPVLSQVLHLEAQAESTPDILARIMSGLGGTLAAATAIGEGTAAAAVGEGVTTGAAAGSGQAASAAALGGSTKLIIGTVAIATAVGGAAATGVFPGNLPPAVLAESPPGQEAQNIDTLEEMIGQEAADQLRDFVAGPVAKEDWLAFLDSLPATLLRNGDDGTAQYALYHLEKQDKQLLLLERREAGRLAVAYRFTDSHEPAPEKLTLFDSWEGWRQ